MIKETTLYRKLGNESMLHSHIGFRIITSPFRYLLSVFLQHVWNEFSLSEQIHIIIPILITSLYNNGYDDSLVTF